MTFQAMTTPAYLEAARGPAPAVEADRLADHIRREPARLNEIGFTKNSIPACDYAKLESFCALPASTTPPARTPWIR